MPSPTLPDVLTTLEGDPGRPRLTWYGPDAERVELSGAVLVNWVVKTTNLLVEEFDAGPRAVIGLDLPAHWRTCVWALAVWRAGSELRLVAPDADLGDHLDVVVTTRPSRWRESSGELVAVELAALARQFAGTLPSGTMDAAAAVMTYGDTLGYVEPTDPGALAVGPGTYPGAASVRYEDLLTWADNAGVALDGDRILLTQEGDCTSRAVPDDLPGHVRREAGAPGEPTVPGEWVPEPGRRSTTLAVLRASLEAWLVDGSVVLAGEEVSTRLAQDPDARQRLIATERIAI